ncbi:MAG TPA: CapA family protein [Phycisphaerae bacterium]|nr:CapA family protein [Phycisphaerae bacterium]
MPTILIGADVNPRGRMQAPFQAGDAAAIFNDLLDEFQAADLAIVNMEGPLIAEASPIMRPGSILGAPEACVRGFKNAHIDVVTLANNHIMDHGEAGLKTTLAACRQAGIATVGAGENLLAASRIHTVEVGGVRIGLLAISVSGFWIAGRDFWGANPADLAHYIRTLRGHGQDYDFLVVLFHGGTEHYPYPSPRQIETCRFLVEEGAGAVLCQHTHCPGCFEYYEGAPIVYGQGNLVFDGYPLTRRSSGEGILVRLRIEKGRPCSMDFVPYVQCDHRPGARRMDGIEEERLRRDLLERSDAIRDEEFVRQQWVQFCKKHERLYLSLLRGQGAFVRRLNGRIGWLDQIYSPRKRCLINTLMRQESVREIIETICP